MTRIQPAMGAQHYQTFQVKAPIQTHTRKASCEEVECEQYARGWRMLIDLNTELGQKQAHYIKYDSGRSFTHESLGEGMVELTFRSGQPCFQDHRVRNGRPEVYSVKGGDFRGNPLKTVTRVHKKAEFWIEEFQENSAAINRVIEKG